MTESRTIYAYHDSPELFASTLEERLPGYAMIWLAESPRQES